METFAHSVRPAHSLLRMLLPITENMWHACAFTVDALATRNASRLGTQGDGAGVTDGS